MNLFKMKLHFWYNKFIMSWTSMFMFMSAHLNILVHDMINLLYYEYWTDKQKYLYVYIFDICYGPWKFRFKEIFKKSNFREKWWRNGKIKARKQRDFLGILLYSIIYHKVITAWKMFVFRVILVRFFSHSHWIRRGNSYLSVFNPNEEKYRS